ncbi:MAG: glycoside hydrolase family 16 protein [Clostridia bacterium]|nr:glycoside hydrolase family 16 protein [Clostridia bacterium]
MKRFADIKKLISIILIMSLALSIFTVNYSAEYTPNNIGVWNGSTVAPKDQNSDGVYEINTAEELAYIVSTGGAAGAKYQLMADIYLNEIDKVNWQTGETVGNYSPRPWYDSVEFQGNINGNGHIVYGIYYNAGLETSEMTEGWVKPVGLIPAIKNSSTVTIEKLGINNMYINAKHIASAFIGRAGNSSATTEEARSRIYIDQCFVGEDVSVTAFCAGVFRGYSRKSAIHISNSYNLGIFRSNSDKKNDVDGGTYDYRFSWFVGNNWGLGTTAEDFSITNCYNATGSLLKAHFATYNPLITNSYAAGLTHDKNGDGVAEEVWYSDAGNIPLTKERMQGADVLDNVYKMPYLNANDKYLATEGYPVLKVFAGLAYDDVTEVHNVNIWDGKIAERLDGEGTKASPYLITNGAELALAITSGGGENKFYKLTNNIYLNDISKINWTTGVAKLGYNPNSWFDNVAFSGNINGNGYVVYGLYFKTVAENIGWGYWGNGLIPRVNVGASVTVTALGIDNAYVYGVNGASAFVGFAGQTAYTDDVSAKANIVIDRCFVGKNVYLLGNDTGAFRGGTFCSNLTITNSYSQATMRGATSGFFGNVWASTVNIENCYNTLGAVTTDIYSWEEVAKNLKGVYVTEAANYPGEVIVLSADKMQGFANKMNLPNDIFVSNENGTPVIKDFFKFSATKGEEDYIGYTYSQYAKLFLSNSTGAKFWRFDTIDATGDNQMNICDLVYSVKKSNNAKTTIDIDNDKETTSFDITILRNALIGNTDYQEHPVQYTPQYNNISSKYRFVWGDEFNTTYLDGNKWTIHAKMNANPSKGMYNDKDEKVINVENGSLRLTAYKADDGTYHVPTSVITRNTMNFKYGYVEIRAKLPLQTGVWTSFWAVTVADSAGVERLSIPKCSDVAEIDMFEVFGTNQVSGGIIKWAGENWYPKGTNGLQRVALEQDDQYHIFGYEWTPSEIIMYCDGVLYARFDITEPWLNPGEYGKGKEGWTYTNADNTGTDMSCFNDPQYLIFNNHIFYEGVSNANQYINISNPDFKRADYLIDYCRVYQLEGSEIYTK